MARRRYILIIVLLALSLFAAAATALAVGSVRLTLGDVFRTLAAFGRNGGEDISATILFSIRMPRILLAMGVGASLAVSGAGFQGFFRNSLADPYVIGASSGAALGAAIALVLALPAWGPLSSASLFAFAGALFATFLAFLISKSAGDPPPAAALLLAGTALSSLFSALLSLILVLRDKDMHRVYYWLLGGLGGATWIELLATVPVMALGCAMVFLAARPLDLMVQGEEAAESLGLDIKKARLIVAMGASLAAAAAVSATGIIGFVGLVAPHAVRMVTGPSHRRLLPASAMGGALLVLLADIVARTIAAPLELPIGIVTSAVGAPFFLYLLARRGRSLGRL
jgi:iron complex transport system permease protein